MMKELFYALLESARAIGDALWSIVCIPTSIKEIQR